MNEMRLDRKRALWIIFLLFVLFLFTAGCGYDGNSTGDSKDTGGIAFNIEWPELDLLATESSSKSTAEEYCLNGTISYVVFAVYDKDGNLLVDLEDATFDCEDRKGVVKKIPAQSGIRLVVFGLSYNEETAMDDILLRGEYGGDITVEVGKTTQLGAIETYEFMSGLSRPIRGASLMAFVGLTFEWTGARGASLYKITLNRLTPTGAEPIEMVTSDVSVSMDLSDDNFFVNSGLYSWTVVPVDAFGNHGKESELRRFSIYISDN